MKAIYLFSILSLVSNQKLAKVLNDKNFEHDTQATTGSTTGDWFLLFCDSAVCGQQELDTWDELYGRLRGKATVAYIDVDNSPETKARFQVGNLPQATFIKQGNFYNFKTQGVLDVSALELFVTDTQYDAVPYLFPEDFGAIPKVPSFMDNFSGLGEALMIVHPDGSFNILAIIPMIFLFIGIMHMLAKDKKKTKVTLKRKK